MDKKIDWDKQRLGELPDTLIARMLAVNVSSVVYQRKKRGIAPAGSGDTKVRAFDRFERENPQW